LDDRGWTTSAPLGGTAGGQEARMSVTHVVRDAYDVVLPDNAEETGEEHCRIAWLHLILDGLGLG
jgi:hypothetical protein